MFYGGSERVGYQITSRGRAFRTAVELQALGAKLAQMLQIQLLQLLQIALVCDFHSVDSAAIGFFSDLFPKIRVCNNLGYLAF